MESWELTAREEIRDLVSSYAHFVDSGQIQELVDLFAPDGAIEVAGSDGFDSQSALGAEALTSFFSGVGSSLRSADVPRIRHHTSNLRITVVGPEEARSECYFLCLTDAGVDHWGRYRDGYTRVGSRWRFADRLVRTDGWIAGGFAASRRQGTSG